MGKKNSHTGSSKQKTRHAGLTPGGKATMCVVEVAECEVGWGEPGPAPADVVDDNDGRDIAEVDNGEQRHLRPHDLAVQRYNEQVDHSAQINERVHAERERLQRERL